MKRFLLALALVAVAGATYVATAPGGQLAGPTAKQFKALQKEVAGLKKELAVVKETTTVDTQVLTDCMAHAVPIDQFGDRQSNPFNNAYGYTWTDPNQNGGTPWLETALDVTAPDDPSALFITGGGPACGTDIGAALHRAGRMSGIRVHRTAPLTGFH